MKKNEELDQEADIITFDTLSSKDIGNTEEEKKKESDKELREAIENKPQNTDYFGLNSEGEEDSTKEEEQKKEKPSTESKKEESKDEEKNTESEILKKSLRKKYGDEIETFIKEDENGEEVEVQLDDIELDLDTYHQIVEAKHQSDIEDSTKGKVDISKNSDFAKRILEIDKKGGRYTDLLKIQDDIINPLDNIDLETEQGQIEVIALRLRGRDQDEVSRLIRSYKSDGILKEQAQEAKKEIEEWFNNEVKAREEEASKREEETKKVLKQFRKDLRSNLDSFELKDSVKDKLVELATTQGEDGRFGIDILYSKKRRDPELAARLALYLFDEEEYKGQITKMEVNKEKQERASRIKIKPTISQGGDKKGKKSKKDEGVITIPGMELN